MADQWDGAALALGPVAYWPLDDDGTWADASGNGHTLTESGTVATAALSDGKVGADFSGSTYLYAADHADLRPETMPAWSVSMWVQRDGATTAGLFAKYTATGSPDTGITCGLWGGTEFYGAWGSGAGTNQTDSPNNRYQAVDDDTVLNTAEHWVFTFDYTNQTAGDFGSAQIYKDGALVATMGSYDNAEPWEWYGNTTGLNLTIGFSAYGAQYLDGKIAKVAYYDKVLTPAEALLLYEGAGGSVEIGGARRSVLTQAGEGPVGVGGARRSTLTQAGTGPVGIGGVRRSVLLVDVPTYLVGLSADPESPQPNGTAVTLTASVQPNPGDVGQVTFYDDATVLGAVPVVGGQAELEVPALIVGTHPLRAEWDDGWTP